MVLNRIQMICLAQLMKRVEDDKTPRIVFKSDDVCLFAVKLNAGASVQAIKASADGECVGMILVDQVEDDYVAFVAEAE